MSKLTVIERTEHIYQVELTQEQYIRAEESDEGFDEIYEAMSDKLELIETKVGPNSKFILKQ
jgi:hypothetical protein